MPGLTHSTRLLGVPLRVLIENHSVSNPFKENLWTRQNLEITEETHAALTHQSLGEGLQDPGKFSKKQSVIIRKPVTGRRQEGVWADPETRVPTHLDLCHLEVGRRGGPHPRLAQENMNLDEDGLRQEVTGRENVVVVEPGHQSIITGLEVEVAQGLGNITTITGTDLTELKRELKTRIK